MSLCVLAHSPGTVLLLKVFFSICSLPLIVGPRTVTSLHAKETNARERCDMLKIEKVLKYAGDVFYEKY